MSHSKRNTSRAVFTSYERSLAKANWTVNKARLTRDSFLPFASCGLCLETADDPVACPAGDIFCRECALNNILAQKQEARRLEKRREHEERELAAQQSRDDAEAQARAVQEFELVQAGLEGAPPPGGRRAKAVAPSIQAATSSSTPATNADPGEASLASPPRDSESKKRKFTLDDDELLRIADADRAKARRHIEADRAAAKEATALPSFWAPSVTPSGSSGSKSSTRQDGDTSATPSSAPATLTIVPLLPVCPASQARPHTYSLHTLVPVHFSTDTSTPPHRVCPACSKTLSNSSKAILAKPCGHVLCRSCVHQFVKPLAGGANGSGSNGGSGGTAAAVLFDPHAPPGTTGHVRCYVCEIDLEEVRGGDDNGGEETKGSSKKDKKAKKDKKDKRPKIQPGLVELRSEGTGFSASGASEVKRNAVAFQC